MNLIAYVTDHDRYLKLSPIAQETGPIDSIRTAIWLISDGMGLSPLDGSSPGPLGTTG